MAASVSLKNGFEFLQSEFKNLSHLDENNSSTRVVVKSKKKKKRKKRKSQGNQIKPKNNETDSDIDKATNEECRDSASVVHDENIDAKTSHPIHEEEDMDTSSLDDVLPLSQRLEIAAGSDDLSSALVGLVTWLDRYGSSEDIEVLFSSNALQILVTNILSSGELNDIIFERLEVFLASCLKCNTSSSLDASVNEWSNILTKKLKKIKESHIALKSMSDTTSILKNVVHEIVCLVKKFHEFLRGFLLDSSSQHTNDLAMKINSIEEQASHIRGNSTRSLFQLRDLRSDMVSLLFQKWDIDSASWNQYPKREVPSAQLISSPDSIYFDTSIPPSIQEAILKVTSLLEENAKRQELHISPFYSDKDHHQAELDRLCQKREIILNELKRIDEKIKCEENSLNAVNNKISSLHASFNCENKKIETENQLALTYFKEAELKKNIQQEFQDLNTSLKNISNQLLAAKSNFTQPNISLSIKSYLNTLVLYFGSERKCVEFLKSRVRQTSTKINSVRAEIVEYKNLGISSVAKDLQRSLDADEMALNEDNACIRTFLSRAKTVFLHFKKVYGHYTEEMLLFKAIVLELRSHFIFFGLSFEQKNMLEKLVLHAPSTKESIVKSSDISMNISPKSNQSVPTKKWFSWASSNVPTTVESNETGKSIYEIQAEELEGKLTIENLARLEKGEALSISPLLDQIRNVQANENK